MSKPEKSENNKMVIEMMQEYESELEKLEIGELILHINKLLKNCEKIKVGSIRRNIIKLLVLKGDIFKKELGRIEEATECYKKAKKLGENILKGEETAEIKLKIGESLVQMGSNNQAELYLGESLQYWFDTGTLNEVQSYRLLGIVQMRKKRFKGANQCFDNALEVLDKVSEQGTREKVIKSKIYSDKAFNYFMDGINRENAKKSIGIMRKAIRLLEECKEDKEAAVKIRDNLAIHKIKLGEVYNALGYYKEALQIADETEELIKKHKISNSDIFYVKGIIARERGLSYLRLNKVEEAYGYFERAKGIFTKSMTGDYLFKIKMHEAECLIRLSRLEEAMEVFKEMFEIPEREKNHYSDLFYNTCYYHAGIIKYRQGELEESKKYFEDFVRSMKVFCEEILSIEDYNKLLEQNAFEENPKDIKEYFENSLKIFEAVYWKDYEFTKYYLEKV